MFCLLEACEKTIGTKRTCLTFFSPNGVSQLDISEQMTDLKRDQRVLFPSENHSYFSRRYASLMLSI